jgi:ferritin
MSSPMLVSSIIIVLFSPLIFGAGFRSLYENQVQKEFLASNTYLTFAHRLAAHGAYHGFANFFFESAEEEREHGIKLLDYYNVRDNEMSFYDIKINDVNAEMEDLATMIQTAAKMEKDVYDNLILLRTAATTERDYPTVHFIEKQMLEEQTTAMKYINDLVKRIDRNSDSGTIVLQMMDQDLRKKQIKKP